MVSNHKRFENLIGKKFGRLSVVECLGRTRPNGFIWFCKCDCGNTVSVRGNHLKSERTVSCGCFRMEHSTLKATKHGDAKHGNFPSEYTTWASMKQRCQDIHCSAYPLYGGRGISVCKEWASSYPTFLKDMGRKPSPAHTLDRINNNGNYSPENCRWVTRKTQANNRRSNHFLTFNGQTITLAQWAELLNISASSLRYRIRSGMNHAEALCKSFKQI